MALIDEPIVFALISLLTYYSLGAYESRSNGGYLGILWAGLSASVSFVVLVMLNGTWFWLLASQIGLFFAIALFRSAKQQ